MASKEERREVYQWHKSKNICVKCGREKARKGRVTCFECGEKDTLRERKITEEQRKKRLAYNKRKRDLCVAFGVCRNCLKRDAVKGKFCLECYVKYTRRNKEKAEQKEREGNVIRSLRVEYGKCYFCGKDVVEGKGTCPSCYNNRKVAILKNKYKYINTSHPWRLIVSQDLMKGKAV